MIEEGVVHGDIKPQNVLVFGGINVPYFARVTDFGYSTFFAKPGDKILMPQTRFWVAPEYCKGQLVDREAAQKMDVYSFGLLCLWLILYNDCRSNTATLYADLESGTPPVEVAMQKLQGRDDLENKEGLREFFTHSLSPSPENRCPNLSDILGLLGKQWYVRRCP